MSKLVVIAGGSGSGKSTLAVSLCKNNPEVFSLVHLDDYFRKSTDAPRKGEYINWDDPECIRFDDLVKDIHFLLAGNSIEVQTKSELYYPDYDPENPLRISQKIHPRNIILLEGYLALHDSRIRNLSNFSIYLDMPIQKSISRRSNNKVTKQQDYFEKVLIPAHQEFVEPARQYADLIIEVSEAAPDEVYKEVCGKIKLSFPSVFTNSTPKR